jgi:hypothetical protein
MEHDTGASDLAKVVIKTSSRQGEMQFGQFADSGDAVVGGGLAEKLGA